PEDNHKRTKVPLLTRRSIVAVGLQGCSKAFHFSRGQLTLRGLSNKDQYPSLYSVAWLKKAIEELSMFPIPNFRRQNDFSQKDFRCDVSKCQGVRDCCALLIRVVKYWIVRCKQKMPESEIAGSDISKHLVIVTVLIA
ncbi:MAG: hypothetical protein WD182_08155, partial [Bacteroidota bacterium]